MKIGIYPGSFNPWHKGHKDIMEKALLVFDEIWVTRMVNPDKHKELDVDTMLLASKLAHFKRVKVDYSSMTLVGYIDILKKENPKYQFSIIRGLRNGHDLQYEMNNQYWNEDVGVDIPFVYFITDRSLAHVSSSAIRSVNQLGLKHEY